MIEQQVHILFPHQLFKNSEALSKCREIFLVEEYLYFSHYKYHKQKIAFHRASMKAYQSYLESLGKEVHYIEAADDLSDVRKLLPQLADKGVQTIHLIDPTDNWLDKRIKKSSTRLHIIWYNSPLFINTKDDLRAFFTSSKKKFYQTSFYKEQRKVHNILMNNGKPIGGRWTFDKENRKKYPKDKTPPTIHFPDKSKYHTDAALYVAKYFEHNYGQLNNSVTYPVDFESADAWLNQFLEERFQEFGIYEDAIVKEENYLNHSLLSPLLNVGLLQPAEVLEKAISSAGKHAVPISSTEGFVRQILGWREFIRGVYEVRGSQQRTENFWNFSRTIPKSFYNATTGITPVDDVIKKVLETGYAHHIERLMILGNFMVLCEFDPDDVHQWFMELFIDAYDWVMVPNVYGMSMFADAGLMSTKPYISSSNYIMKMSNYKKGEWQATWDGLFWKFMNKNREFFLGNPRMSMLIRTLDKMKDQTRENHLRLAGVFISKLDKK